MGILRLPTVLLLKVNQICGKYCPNPRMTLEMPHVIAHTLTALSLGCSLPAPASGTLLPSDDVGGELGRV